MQGQIPFEESINLENANPDQEVHCHYDLEDCRASLINSRKISVRAILSLHCCQEEEHILAIGTGIVSDDAVQAEMGDSAWEADLFTVIYMLHGQNQKHGL